MNPSKIYNQYGIPLNLQEHMLRVGALASILLDHWIGPTVNKPAIIQTCLFHDIAKPLTFDMASQAKYVNSAQELESIRHTHDSLIARYGHNEHQAAIKIFKEMGCLPHSIELINDLEWIYLPRLLKANKLDSLIPIYCDMRIGPKGILSMPDRLADLQTRKQVEGINVILESGKLLEQTISQNINTDPNILTATDLNLALKNLEASSLN
jgi:hypothetical protein